MKFNHFKKVQFISGLPRRKKTRYINIDNAGDTL